MASKKHKNFFGDTYTSHTDKWGRPTGESRTTKMFLGGKTTTTSRYGGGTTVSNHYGKNTYSKKYK